MKRLLRFTSSTGSHGVGNNKIVIVKPRNKKNPEILVESQMEQ